MSDFEQHDENDTTFLASVYVDGEATIDQRAFVETSPEALAEVEQLGQVRSVLAATAPEASLSERESHLAAALDVWERMSGPERTGEVTPSAGIDAAAGAAVTTPISSARRKTSERRRTGSVTTSQWLLGAAAALVLIAGVGAGVRNIANDNGSDASDVAVAPADVDPGSEADAVESDEAIEVQGGNVGTELAPGVSDLSDAVVSDGLFADDTTASDQAGDAAATAEAPAATSAAEEPAPPPDEGLIAIDTPEDLGVYGRLAIQTLESSRDGNADIDFEPVFGSCEDVLGLEERFEPVLYQGVQVAVGIDRSQSRVIAYTADDCAIVESVRLPDDTRDDGAAVTTP